MTLTERLLHWRMLRVWTRAEAQAREAKLPALRALRGRARAIRRRIDRVLHIADGRLSLPPTGPAIEMPLHCDWAWRPEIWSGPISPSGLAAVATRTPVGSEASVHHDCTTSELCVRQVRSTRDRELAPFGLLLDVFHFDGSFLSLVIDLPDSAVKGLEKRHLVRLSASAETERKIEIFARLNIRHGPNTEQLVRELPLGEGELMVEFDLAYSNLNEQRIEKAWLDLIFEGPEMNQVLLRDVTLTRRPRSDF
jgi:hypothetical protein